MTFYDRRIFASPCKRPDAQLECSRDLVQALQVGLCDGFLNSLEHWYGDAECRRGSYSPGVHGDRQCLDEPRGERDLPVLLLLRLEKGKGYLNITCVLGCLRMFLSYLESRKKKGRQASPGFRSFACRFCSCEDRLLLVPVRRLAPVKPNGHWEGPGGSGWHASLGRLPTFLIYEQGFRPPLPCDLFVGV